MAHSDDALARVKAMEIACAFSPSDFQEYLREGGPVEHGELCKGFQYSGSYCGRNIEKIYHKAFSSGRLCLRKAVDALLGDKVKHVLIVSGFFVLHDRGGQAPNGSRGSCETDGPLGALAILRALAKRGVRASLFCDEHNGPVLKKAYDSMMAHYADFDAETHELLQKFSCCLPAIGDSPAGATAAMLEMYREKAYGGGSCTALQDRWTLLAHRLGDVLETEVDALVALERLGAPYRNIRGVDIGTDTEPIDFLFPFLDWDGLGDEEIRHRVRSYAAENKYKPDVWEKLCRIAKVNPKAVSLGIGDGGNEVGMGVVVAIPGVPQLSPGDEFAALSRNGCYRACDHLILGTVSNWAGSAFESAADVLYPLVPKDSRGGSWTPADLEEKILRSIMAAPTFAVDGKYNDRLQSVDGMSFEPYHRQFYDFIWALASPREEQPQKVRRLG